MGYPVTYRCPRCGAVVELPREGYLADRAVTPYPLEGWRYVDPTDDYAADAADGIRFVCGESGGCSWRDPGCGEPFYLSFVRFEGGEAVEPPPESETVELAGGTGSPFGPDAGPRGPDGPDGPG